MLGLEGCKINQHFISFSCVGQRSGLCELALALYHVRLLGLLAGPFTHRAVVCVRWADVRFSVYLTVFSSFLLSLCPPPLFCGIGG